MFQRSHSSTDESSSTLQAQGASRKYWLCLQRLFREIIYRGLSRVLGDICPASKQQVANIYSHVKGFEYCKCKSQNISVLKFIPLLEYSNAWAGIPELPGTFSDRHPPSQIVLVPALLRMGFHADFIIISMIRQNTHTHTRPIVLPLSLTREVKSFV